MRRLFAALLLTLSACLPLLAHANTPVEGKHYLVVPAPQPGTPGKIEVAEFFWYGCPACYALEPKLEAWLKRLPADVQFRRSPAVMAPHWQPMARAFFALEATGTDLHSRIFHALHRDNVNLNEESVFLQWVGKQGADATKVGDAYRSFGVRGKVESARQQNMQFGLTSVPSLVVGGRYVTSPSLAGGADRMLEVADYLIELSRKNRR